MGHDTILAQQKFPSHLEPGSSRQQCIKTTRAPFQPSTLQEFHIHNTETRVRRLTPQPHENVNNSAGHLQNAAQMRSVIHDTNKRSFSSSALRVHLAPGTPVGLLDHFRGGQGGQG